VELLVTRRKQGQERSKSTFFHRCLQSLFFFLASLANPTPQPTCFKLASLDLSFACVNIEAMNSLFQIGLQGWASIDKGFQKVNSHCSHQIIINWTLLCKKGIYSILGWFLFFAGSSQFLADWLVLTWKASLHNWFCCFALHFWEITYAKNSVFQGYLFEIFCWTKNKSRAWH